MNLKQEMDEYLEKLWYMKEDNTELIDNLRDSVGEAYSPEVVDSLKTQGFVKIFGDEKKINLTDKEFGPVRTECGFPIEGPSIR